MAQQVWESGSINCQGGKVIIITGSNSGLGFEEARVLSGKDAVVVMAARNMEKSEKAVKKIKKEFPSADVRPMHLDLSDLASVAAFAENFKASFSRLDLLINNAGIMAPPQGKTKNGFELQMGTNHLGHFALTGRLMDMIRSTRESRIVNVSSIAHKMGNINFDDLHWEKRAYKKWDAYGDSKLANLYFTFGLQKRLEKVKSSVMVAAAHPGWTHTDLQRHSLFASTLNHFFAQAIPMGVLPTLYAATQKDVRSGDFIGASGFMEMRGYPGKVIPTKRAKDPGPAETLWNLSEVITGVKYEF
ncbi:MAG: short-chain dehydrogenase [Desulfobacterales bacterium RIFOXYA12_FULL_46_15]|nr:MAG: short-chain dehydrogenase [Desulfobacterales bacterium RIFOXYA12_FULL_46_15]